MTTIPNTAGSGSFITLTPEAFTGNGTFQQLLLIRVRDIESPTGKIRIRGTVAGSALTGLKVTKQITGGQAHSDYFIDADLDTPMNVLPWTSKVGTSLYLTPAGSAFEFVVDAIGLNEIGVSVKSAGSGTVTFEVGI